MSTLIRLSYRFWWIIILVCLGLTVAAVRQVVDIQVSRDPAGGWPRVTCKPTGKLKISVSADELMPKDTPLRLRYEEVKKTFGSDALAVVYVEDPELWTHEKLTRLQRLSEEAAKLEQVERVESLFTVDDIQGEEGWISVSPLLESPPPKDAAQLKAKRQQAVENPLLRRNVISPDGNATLVTLYLKPEHLGQEGFEEQMYADLEALLKEHQGAFSKVFQLGDPAVTVWMKDFILLDQVKLLPLSGLVLVVLIALLMRSFGAAVLQVVNATVATVWTLGLMAYFGVPINMFNYIIPALILVIGSSQDVHLMTELRECMRTGMLPKEAVRHTGRRIGLALLLASGTTIMGFGATSVTDIAILRDFGVTAAAALTIRFFVGLTLLPACFALLTWRHRHTGQKVKRTAEGAVAHPWYQPAADWLGARIIRYATLYPTRVFWVFALTCVPAVILMSQIKLGNDFVSFLKPDSQLVGRLNTVAERLAGTKVIYITLVDDPGTFKQAEKLKQVFSLAQYLRGRPECDTVVSIADYVALVNQEMTGGDTANYRIPDTNALAAQFLLFFHSSQIQPYVTGDFGQANVVVRCNVNDTHAFNALVADIERQLGQGRFGPWVFSVSGQSVITAASVDQIAKGQVSSLSLMVIALFSIMAALFVSVRCGVLAVLPNLWPVLIVFGIMGAFGIPLNLGTCMVAAITIGMAVDDTIHLMVRYNQELKALKNEHKAIAKSIEGEIFPVCTTSAALAGGFVVLGFSSFVPVQQFGMLSAVVMVVALVADLFLTPALLATTRLITLWDLLGLRLRQALMERSPVFSGMTSWQTKKLILAATVEEVPQGTRLIRDGETGDKMYVIIDGEMEVTKQTITGERLSLKRLGVGEVIGEVALVAHTKRTADVDAVTNVKLLALDWETLQKLQRFAPYLSSRLFLNIAKILGMRLVDSLGQLSGSRPPFGNKGNGGPKTSVPVPK